MPSDPSAVQLMCQTERGTTHAEVVPAWGANVTEFSYRATNWAEALQVLETPSQVALARKPTSYGIPILAPTPGRVGRGQSGTFVFGDKEYQMEPSRHGVLRHHAWAVTGYDDSTVECDVRVRPKAGLPDCFPFWFDARYRVQVQHCELMLELTIRNTGDRCQPIDVGWHPYLYSRGKRVVHIPATHRWHLFADPEPTPTGEKIAVSACDDFRDGKVIGVRDRWDDVFSLSSESDGTATSWLENDHSITTVNGSQADHRVRRWVRVAARTDVRTNCPLPYMQLYTPPRRNTTSLEPLSAIPNAINLADAGKTSFNLLCVGEEATWRVSIGLKAEPL